MRLVDADSAKNSFSDFGVTGRALRRMFDDLPTVDPIHATGGCYCRECRYADNSAGPNILCKKFYGAGSMDGFCYWGQKEDEHD